MRRQTSRTSSPGEYRPGMVQEEPGRGCVFGCLLSAAFWMLVTMAVLWATGCTQITTYYPRCIVTVIDTVENTVKIDTLDYVPAWCAEAFIDSVRG